jgi:pyridoxine 5-phosphate synthase
MAYGMVDGPSALCHQRSAISHDMVRLSVNVNKVATLRNSRGGREPNVIEAVEVCIAAGAPGITVHPRADRRHITPDDVRAIAATVRGHPGIE